MTKPVTSEGSRVLITGASGFVGKHAVAVMAGKGYRVTALHNRGELPDGIKSVCHRIVRGDVCDHHTQVDAMRDVDAIVHLAAYIPPRYDDYKEAELCYRVNALATLNLAAAAIERGVKRFVYASTGNMYSQSGRPCAENDFVFPSETATYYFASKLAGELYTTHISRNTKTNALILRIGTPYGPGEPEQKVVTTFMRRASRGDELKVVKGGTARYNFVHVEDVADCLAMAVESGEPGIYNLSSGEHSSLRSLAETVAMVYEDRKAPVQVEPVPAAAPAGLPAMSIEKARKTWGYSPMSLLDGLRKYRDELDKEPAAP